MITAIKTPYTRNGKFDLVAFDQMVEYQIQCGVDGLIIGGTTGEGQLMSWDEHVMLIAHTARVFGDNILVIGNTGGPCCILTSPVLDPLCANKRSHAHRLQGCLTSCSLYMPMPTAGSNSTREALHATEQGFAVGMHAALQINPYYGKTSMDGLLMHFRALLEEGPAIIYNVPGRTGQDIPDRVIEELAREPNFLGVKECTGNQRIQVHVSRQ